MSSREEEVVRTEIAVRFPPRPHDPSRVSISIVNSCCTRTKDLQPFNFYFADDVGMMALDHGACEARAGIWLECKGGTKHHAPSRFFQLLASRTRLRCFGDRGTGGVIKWVSKMLVLRQRLQLWICRKEGRPPHRIVMQPVS
jgi:hypothetical protein